MAHVEVGLEPLAVSFWQLAISCQLLATLTKFLHHVVQLLLFHIAQQTVEVEMVQLQIEVGSHEIGEARVVVALVHMEQLVVLGWYDGKAVASQFVLQRCRILRQLHGIHHVVHVDAVTALAGYEVLLFQLFFAC